MADVTQLFAELDPNDPRAPERLFELLYGQLRAMAQTELRGHMRPVAEVTSLVHEAYLKLCRGALAEVKDRAHFLGLASRTMRQIVVDRARARLTAKRGGSEAHVELDEALELPQQVGPEQMVAVDEALRRIEAIDPRLVEVVELYFFAGLTAEEVAGLLGTSARTIRRDWEKARGLLTLALGEDGRHGPA
jgi:RNA polymerase sigma factor (TIGR02999 family)